MSPLTTDLAALADKAPLAGIAARLDVHIDLQASRIAPDASGIISGEVVVVCEPRPYSARSVMASAVHVELLEVYGADCTARVSIQTQVAPEELLWVRHKATGMAQYVILALPWRDPLAMAKRAHAFVETVVCHYEQSKPDGFLTSGSADAIVPPFHELCLSPEEQLHMYQTVCEALGKPPCSLLELYETLHTHNVCTPPALQARRILFY